jgi:hypothetical protein
VHHLALGVHHGREFTRWMRKRVEKLTSGGVTVL